MVKAFAPVRGTHDIFGEKAQLFNQIKDVCKEVAFAYNFSSIYTPIFEDTEVFKRTLGDESDIVNKEMYTFLTKKGSSVTLRPEGTAPAVRAYIFNNLANTLLQKLFYFGPMFRYERPQKGRQRQFHQVGFEVFNANSLYSDVEIILAAKDILQKLGIFKGITLELNYLGSLQTRQDYALKLVNYLEDYKEELSEDSKQRLLKNPLRILDSKNAKDREILKNAPLIQDCFKDEDTKEFNEIKELLSFHGVDFVVNSSLVRGLDYYTGFVFEFVSCNLGSQATVLSGGRYNNLVEQMGGKSTPCVGFAAGVERLMLLIEQEQTPKQQELVLILPFESKFNKQAMKLRQDFVANGIKSDIILDDVNISKKMKKANAKNASLVVVVDECEKSLTRYLLKDMKSSLQQEFSKQDAIKHIKENYKELVKCRL